MELKTLFYLKDQLEIATESLMDSDMEEEFDEAMEAMATVCREIDLELEVTYNILTDEDISKYEYAGKGGSVFYKLKIVFKDGTEILYPLYKCREEIKSYFWVEEKQTYLVLDEEYMTLMWNNYVTTKEEN